MNTNEGKILAAANIIQRYLLDLNPDILEEVLISKTDTKEEQTVNDLLQMIKQASAENHRAIRIGSNPAVNTALMNSINFLS